MGTKRKTPLNKSLQNLNAIAADLNAAGKPVTIKRLKTRKMRKGEGMTRNAQQAWFSKWEESRPRGVHGTWNISDRH